jgi:D-galactarolactone isomerase
MISDATPSEAGKGKGRPVRRLPPKACDCHMHVYGPAARFPYPPKRTADPPDATFEDYLTLRRLLGFERTVFVQPSAYGADNRCALDAIARLAPDARGIATIDPEASEEDLARLHDGGMRGTRFHQMVVGCLRLDVLESVAERTRPFGWHVQVQCEGDDLVDLEPRLRALPVDVVIDHMGRIPVEEGADRPAFKALMRLVDTGRCWVKLSSPYHVSREGPPAYEDCAARAGALIEAAPERMLYGTNWPHPSLTEKPDDVRLLDVLIAWAGDDATLRTILVDNPNALFGFVD